MLMSTATDSHLTELPTKAFRASASQRYLPIAAFMAKHFDHKVQKITLNAGFTCPNRDGLLGYGGCTYCNNRAFHPNTGTPHSNLRRQLEQGKEFFARARRLRAERRGRPLSVREQNIRFLAYFQAYTNTYAELQHLMTLYEEALSVPDVVGLVIGTRPDCMPDELLDYLSQLHRESFVLVEYGVESTSNATLQRICRGHDFACAVETIGRTAQHGLPVGAHFILGLPGESHDFIVSQAETISRLPLDTIKLHQLQIIRGTAMAREFLEEQKRAAENPAAPCDFHLYSPEDYARLIVDFLERLRPDIAVERFTSSSPSELLIAPDWGLKNYEFTAIVQRELIRRNTWQGRLCSS